MLFDLHWKRLLGTDLERESSFSRLDIPAAMTSQTPEFPCSVSWGIAGNNPRDERDLCHQFPNHSRRIGAISNWVHEEGGIWKRERVAEEQRGEARRKSVTAQGQEGFMQPVGCHHLSESLRCFLLPPLLLRTHKLLSKLLTCPQNTSLSSCLRSSEKKWKPQLRKFISPGALGLLAADLSRPEVPFGRSHSSEYCQILHRDPFTITAKRLQKNYESISTLKPSYYLERFFHPPPSYLFIQVWTLLGDLLFVIWFDLD